MMDQRISPTPAGDDGTGHGPAAGEPRAVLVEQAGQVELGRAVVGVHRTLQDEHSPYAVLRSRCGDEVTELTARPGEEIDVPGAGPVRVAEVRASTQERRGAVLLQTR